MQRDPENGPSGEDTALDIESTPKRPRTLTLLRAVRPEHGYLLVVVMIVVVAPMKLGWRARRDGLILFMPDLFETLAATVGAAHGSQYVGAWSRLGLYHPGPLWFYWAAPFTAFSSDQPASLFFSALTLVAVCSAATLAVVCRAAGPNSAIMAALVLMVALHQLSLAGLAYPWNPTVLILPVVLGLVCVAAVAATGSMPTAFVGLLAGSFVAQAHLGSLPLGGAIVVATIAALVLARRGQSTKVHTWVLLGCLAVVPWLPVLYDQAYGEQNLATVVSYLATGDVDERFPPEPSSASPSFSLPQVATRYVAMASLAEQGTARWGGADVAGGLEHDPSRVSLAAMVAALALVGLGAIGSIPRTSVRFAPFVAWLSRAALVAFAIEGVAAIRVRGEFRYYLIAGVSGVGVVGWMAAALVAAGVAKSIFETSRLGQRHWLQHAGHAVAIVAVLLLAQTKPLNSFPGFEVRIDQSDATVSEILDQVPSGDFLMRVDDLSSLSSANRLALSLQHHGRRVNVTGRYVSHFADRNRQSQSGIAITLIPPSEDAPPGCENMGMYGEYSVCIAPSDL